MTEVGSAQGLDTVTVRYWAGARAAAGVSEEALALAGATVGEARAALASSRPALVAVLPLCSILVDGIAASEDRVLAAGEAVEVLPPFAGG